MLQVFALEYGEQHHDPEVAEWFTPLEPGVVQIA